MKKIATAAVLAAVLAAVAAGGTTHILDVSRTGGTASAEANFLSAASLIEAKAKLGERADELTTLCIHPNVYFYLQQIGALTFSTSALRPLPC